MFRISYLLVFYLLTLSPHLAMAHEQKDPLSVIQELHYNNQHYKVLSDGTGWRFMMEEPLGNRINLFFSTGIPKLISIKTDPTNSNYELISYDAGEAGTSTIVRIIGTIRRHKISGKLEDVSEN